MLNYIKTTLFVVTTATLLAYAPPGGKDKKPKYIDKANMDPSKKPGDNFYLYANGKWLANNPVPASKTRWGSFNMLAEESSKRLKDLLTNAAANTGTSPASQKIGDFYTSGMDSVGRDKLGYQPIKADLQKIDAIKDVNEFLSTLATYRTEGISGLFGFSIQPDRKNVTVYVPALSQGGTTLPDRDYYIKNDARSTTIRNAYTTHIINVFKLVGETCKKSVPQQHI